MIASGSLRYLSCLTWLQQKSWQLTELFLGYTWPSSYNMALSWLVQTNRKIHMCFWHLLVQPHEKPKRRFSGRSRLSGCIRLNQYRHHYWMVQEIKNWHFWRRSRPSHAILVSSCFNLWMAILFHDATVLQGSISGRRSAGFTNFLILATCLYNVSHSMYSTNKDSSFLFICFFNSKDPPYLSIALPPQHASVVT